MLTSLPGVIGFRPYPHGDQQYNLIVDVPAAEPVTYDDMAAHLRLDQDDDQSLVTALTIAGREFVETSCRLTLMETTYTVQYDHFDNRGLKLPRRPVIPGSVGSVTYIDTSGTLQTLDPSQYTVDYKGIHTWIKPAPNLWFPYTEWNKPNAVTITFGAGTGYVDEYGNVQAVSEMAKLAIKTWAAFVYENREAGVVGKQFNELPYAFSAIIQLLGAPEV